MEPIRPHLHSLARSGLFRGRGLVRAPLVGVVACLLALSSVAAAQGKADKQDFAAAQAKAVDLPSPGDLTSRFWSLLATCEGIDNDLEKRQCTVLRAARADQLADRTFSIAGDALSVTAGEYDRRRRVLPIAIRACLSCTETVEVMGQPMYLVGQGTPQVEGDQLRGPVIRTVAVRFPSAAAAEKWQADIIPRLRTRFLVRMPRANPVWSGNAVSAAGVQIVGYRVYDPCSGQIFVSQPKADPLPPNHRACTGADQLALQREKEARNRPKEPTGPVLPERLEPEVIKNALADARQHAAQCYGIYGVSGEARFRLTINGDGTLAKVEQAGDFVDTPTGSCIEEAVKAVKFPASQKESTTINYPFVLTDG